MNYLKEIKKKYKETKDVKIKEFPSYKLKKVE